MATNSHNKKVAAKSAKCKKVETVTRFDTKTTLSLKLTMNGESVKISVPVKEGFGREERRHLFDEIVPLVSNEFDKMNNYDAVTSVKVKRTAKKSNAKKGGK